ncbi:hypothetical protein ACTFIZ_006192 [Dictyostelium cf. discoideum]
MIFLKFILILLCINFINCDNSSNITDSPIITTTLPNTTLPIDTEFNEALINPINRELFINWTREYNKTYTNEEFTIRFENFIRTFLYINTFNNNQNKIMTLGLNGMSDLTFDEFKKYYLSTLDLSEVPNDVFENNPGIEINVNLTTSNTIGGLISGVGGLITGVISTGGGGLITGVIGGGGAAAVANDGANNGGTGGSRTILETSSRPSSFNWRHYGAVTSVKDQKTCGSCYAFSTLAALESKILKNKNINYDLSEQELVDCTDKNKGCEGGWMNPCFDYIQKKGISNEHDYMYTGFKFPICKQSTQKISSSFQYYMVPQDDENALADKILSNGVISVAIDATSREFMSYSSGIFHSNDCSKTRLTHAIALVGYGVEDGVDYWILKNSWGENWGEGGFFRMKRNTGNKCGIATMATYLYLT